MTDDAAKVRENDEEWVRDPSCVEAWPGCYSGGYDPRCCRFPKSCSCLVPAASLDEEERG
jgi:hypothetical protein